MVDFSSYQRRVEEMLEAFGGLYDFHDILHAIQDGEMQSFTDGVTWIVTRIANYPRKKVLEILVAVGDYQGVLSLQPEVVAFAKEQQCDILWTIARVGWEGKMTPGWERSASVYVRAL